MAQTREGALIIAAKKAGLTPEDYTHRMESGLKRCTKCKDWKPVSEFGKDRSRFDGLAAKCGSCTRVKVRKCTKGRVSNFKGMKHSEETKARISAANKGKPGPKPGVPRSLETRLKISKAMRINAKRGPEAPGYIDGKGEERRGVRNSQEYKRWRFDVMARDEFMCAHCGDDRGGNLQVHHIRSFADFPDLRLSRANGITLCHACHWMVHAYDLQLWSPTQI